MITKPADKLYCGVNEDTIKNASPTLNEEVLRYHHLYVTERTEIYKKKDVLNLPQPWTEDEVFLKYRFTNARRELDRESKWLIKNISDNNKFNLKEKILWSMFFRTYNKSSTFEKLNLLETLDIMNFNDSDMEVVRKNITEETIKDPKYVWFTPAFNTGGLKATWAMPSIKGMYECTSSNVQVKVETDSGIKEMTWAEAKLLLKSNPEFIIQGVERSMPMRMLHLVKYVRGTDILDRILVAQDQEEVYNIIKEIDGFSNFLAYQIFVDFTYINDYKFSENEFTISGPGCRAGLDLLFEDKDGMTHDECIFWVRDNIEKEWDKRDLHVDMNVLFDFLPEHDRKLNVMSQENCFCEISKITKAKRGTGRPRNKYIPSASKEFENLDSW